MKSITANTFCAQNNCDNYYKNTKNAAKYSKKLRKAVERKKTREKRLKRKKSSAVTKEQICRRFLFVLFTSECTQSNSNAETLFLRRKAFPFFINFFITLIIHSIL